MNALQHDTRTSHRIDIGNPHDVTVWAERLDVCAELLRDAIVLVGDDADAVALALKGSVPASTWTH